MVCVLIERDGAWIPIGSVELGQDEKVELDVPGLANLDEDGLLSLNASRVRVELRDDAGKISGLVGCTNQCRLPGRFLRSCHGRAAGGDP